MAIPKRSNYIVIDCETGGLKCLTNGITQVGALIVDGVTLEDIDAMSSYIKPYGMSYEQKALDYTNISLSKLEQEGLDVKEVARNFKGFLQKANPSGQARYKPTLIGHNIKFDIGFLTQLLLLIGENLFDYLDENPICTMKLSQQKWNADEEMPSFNLTSCAKKAGLEQVQNHDAMEDVFQTADLFKFHTRLLRSEGTIQSTEKEDSFRTTFQF